MAVENQVTIRDAELPDAELLARIWVDSWRVAYQGILPDPYLLKMEWARYTARWMVRLITQHSSHRTFVAIDEEEEEVVGFCELGVGSQGPEIFTLYVHPSNWRKGYGHRLLDTVLSGLRKQRSRRVVLWVLKANARARRFYEREGFRATQKQRWERVGGTRVPSVCYVCELRH